MKLFPFLRALSFVNSAVFAALPGVSLSSGFQRATTLLGWTHGLMWIALSLLSLVAVRRREMPSWLGFVVVVVGGVGPFAGTVGFVVETRRRRLASGPPVPR